jgi:acetyl-CoA carboxylase carboxyl transferase subunit alpha
VILPFEKPIKELEARIGELQRLAGPNEGLQDEIRRLEEALAEAKKRVYTSLTPYQRVQVARHPDRPGFGEYLGALASEFYELSGDRLSADDPAVRGGVAKVGAQTVVLLGHDKGAVDVKSRVKTNFGMAHPEGYRKAGRLYGLAERLKLPVVALVDTPGAFAGKGAEERGQAWAISEDLVVLARLKVPVISVVIGEGGSGGALAMCLADHVAMLENSYLSVIAPESAASILFRDAKQAARAAEAMKITAQDLFSRGLVDEVLPEPLGGAHQDPGAAVEAVAAAVGKALFRLRRTDPKTLVAARYERYRRIGTHAESPVGRDAPGGSASGGDVPGVSRNGSENSPTRSGGRRARAEAGS